MSNQTRSSLGIDAVASAAALGSGTVPGPLNKIGQIAALAGFVLRLFRTKEQALLDGRPPQAKQSEGRVKAERKQSEGNMGGLNHG